MTYKLLVNEVHGQMVQYRFPCSKRKRIRKKWGCDPRNFRWQAWPPTVLETSKTIVCSPEQAQAIEAARAVMPPGSAEFREWAGI